MKLHARVFADELHSEVTRADKVDPGLRHSAFSHLHVAKNRRVPGQARPEPGDRGVIAREVFPEYAAAIVALLRFGGPAMIAVQIAQESIRQRQVGPGIGIRRTPACKLFLKISGLLVILARLGFAVVVNLQEGQVVIALSEVGAIRDVLWVGGGELLSCRQSLLEINASLRLVGLRRDSDYRGRSVPWPARPGSSGLRDAPNSTLASGRVTVATRPRRRSGVRSHHRAFQACRLTGPDRPGARRCSDSHSQAS